MAYISFQPQDYFNTKLYTGNGSTNAITGIGFSPSWVWIKSRGLARSHQINDAVRGAGKILATDNTGAEFTDTNRITTLDSDGFTLGSNDNVNGSSDNLVSWNWKANGAGVSNTDGSITSTVSANTTSGFSIVKYTGTGSAATIGHGLGAAPQVVICKQLNSAQKWINYHKAIGAGNYLHLNETDASASSSTVWNNTDPTSSVFSVGTAVNCNQSSGTYVAYCFAEKKGFSKFGSYQGNSNVDGAFVYTGFKPAWVMIKQATGGNANEVWGIRDNKRDTFNPIAKSLFANNSSGDATTSTHYVDFVSNGFKIRTGTENALNTNYGYIYMAFAEAPIVSSNGVPAVAR
jgi:hypothetical protein